MPKSPSKTSAVNTSSERQDKPQGGELGEQEFKRQVEEKNRVRKVPVQYDFMEQQRACWTERQVCSYCAETKIGLIGMKMHLKDRHPQHNKHHFRCHECVRVCVSAAQMSEHLLSQHQLFAKTPHVTRFLCVTDFTGTCKRARGDGDADTSAAASFSDVGGGKRQGESPQKQSGMKKSRFEDRSPASGTRDVKSYQPGADWTFKCQACPKSYSNLHSLGMHSKVTHKGFVDFKYVASLPGVVLPTCAIQFRLPKEGWSNQMIDDFEKEIRNPDLIPVGERHLSLTQRVQRRLLVAKAIKQETTNELKSHDDAQLFGEDEGEYGNNELRRVRENRLKSQIKASGFAEYDLLRKKIKFPHPNICMAPGCGKVIPKKSLVSTRNHVMNVHRKLFLRAMKLKCHMCGLESRRVERLSDHYNNKHSMKIPPKLIRRLLIMTDFDLVRNPAEGDDDAEESADEWEGEDASDEDD